MCFVSVKLCGSKGKGDIIPDCNVLLLHYCPGADPVAGGVLGVRTPLYQNKRGKMVKVHVGPLYISAKVLLYMNIGLYCDIRWIFM